MTYFEDIENYIKDLCIKHKKLLHGNGGVSFIQLGIDGETTTVTNRKKTYLRMMDVSASEFNESALVWAVQMAFLYELPAMRTNADVDAASKLTQEILYDFAARIEAQLDEGCYFVNRLQSGTIDPVGITDNSAIGWAYTWRFLTDKPNYNANAWEE
jgi:hypothetical protein